jgi:hypothetical protein
MRDVRILQARQPRGFVGEDLGLLLRLLFVVAVDGHGEVAPERWVLDVGHFE